MLITKAEIDATRRLLLGRPRGQRRGRLDFRVRPISEQWRLVDRMPAYKTAVANVAYIWRDDAPVDRFGPMPARFAERRFELQGSGLLLPASAPRWAEEPYRIWEDADAATAATGNATEISAWHVMLQIPHMTPSGMWPWLVRSFAERQLVARGAPVAWAVHAVEDDDGGWIIAPHAHLIVAARHWRHDLRHGQRHPAWIASWQAQFRLGNAWQHWAKAGAL